MRRALIEIIVAIAFVALALAIVHAHAQAPAAASAAAAPACPALTAHVTVHDYAGPFSLTFCVDDGPGGFRYTGADVYVTGGDPFADGIFHNAFEAAP